MSLPPDQSSMKPRKSARQARSAATVEVIVEAAARILETAGVAGFTTNAVAERAGVSVGSLYQYFPNKDAITRALIRRELASLEAAIGGAREARAPLRSFIEAAVAQQLRRPALARLLDAEEDRLAAAGDVDPVRERVVEALSSILAVAGRSTGPDVVQDVMALIATLVNGSASRGDGNAERLVARVEAVIESRLDTP